MLSKQDLKEAIAATNRGIATTATERQAIASMVARLEELNPTADPLSAPSLLAGDWRLLYTTSGELLGLDRIPLARLGNIYQCIRPERSRIYNLAEIQGLPYLEGLVSVVATFVPATDQPSVSGSALPSRRVNVRFKRAVIGLQRLLNYQSPAQYIAQLEAIEKMPPLKALDFSINAERQQGWLEITYLDQDLRISRGNQGSLFVLTKDP